MTLASFLGKRNALELVRNVKINSVSIVFHTRSFVLIDKKISIRISIKAKNFQNKLQHEQNQINPATSIKTNIS